MSVQDQSEERIAEGGPLRCSQRLDGRGIAKLLPQCLSKESVRRQRQNRQSQPRDCHTVPPDAIWLRRVEFSCPTRAHAGRFASGAETTTARTLSRAATCDPDVIGSSSTVR